MKVLLWAPAGASPTSGGQGVYALGLFRELVRLGQMAVDIAHGDLAQLDHGVFARTILIHPVSRRQLAIEQLIFLAKAVVWMWQNAKNYDAIMGLDSFETTVTPLSIAHKLGLRVVLRLASQRGGFSPTRGIRKVLNRPARRAAVSARFSRIVAISTQMRQDLLGLGIAEDRIAFIPNGVDLNRFRPALPGEKRGLRQELGLPVDAIILLTVATLRPIKRIEWAIEAASALRAMGREVHVVIVGSEHVKAEGYRESLGQLATRIGVADLCVFAGHAKQVEKVYRAADLFCLCSVYEGMPNVLLEAIASGLPACATAVSGVGDVVDDGVSGFVIESPVELAQRCFELLEDDKLMSKIRNAALDKVRGQFTLTAIAQRYYDVLAS